MLPPPLTLTLRITNLGAIESNANRKLDIVDGLAAGLAAGLARFQSPSS
jgi:hypothetical protein